MPVVTASAVDGPEEWTLVNETRSGMTAPNYVNTTCMHGGFATIRWRLADRKPMHYLPLLLKLVVYCVRGTISSSNMAIDKTHIIYIYIYIYIYIHTYDYPNNDVAIHCETNQCYYLC